MVVGVVAYGIGEEISFLLHVILAIVLIFGIFVVGFVPFDLLFDVVVFSFLVFVPLVTMELYI